jgi:hypothetical protein
VPWMKLGNMHVKHARQSSSQSTLATACVCRMGKEVKGWGKVIQTETSSPQTPQRMPLHLNKPRE